MENFQVEDHGMPIIDGNDGNIGNSNITFSPSKGFDEIDLYPNVASDMESRWEQSAFLNGTLVSDELPPIPERYKTLSIDGEKVPLKAQWAYRNEDGRLLFYIQRFDSNTGHKEFRPLSPTLSGDYTEWNRQGPSGLRPLYGLDRLSTNSYASVIICEGEKATDAATRLFPEMVAVCSMNGANSPQKSDWSVLSDRTVMLWGDFDEPGCQYISTVEKLVTTAGSKVIHCINPHWFLQMGTKFGINRETLPEGWDAADAEQEGFTAKNIHLLLNQAKDENLNITLYSSIPSQTAGVDAQLMIAQS